MATNFFESNEFESLKALTKVLGFYEDNNKSISIWEFRKDDLGLLLIVTSDGSCLLFKNKKELARGSFKEIIGSLMENSREPIYETLEEWFASRVTAVATYRRLANKLMENARKKYASMAALEASLTRSLHDLRKTSKIIKEGHQ